VEVANMTVQYSSKIRRGPGSTGNPGGGTSALNQPTTNNVDRWTVGTEQYGTLAFEEKRHVRGLMTGDLTLTEALQFAEVVEEEADEEEADDRVTLGDPNVASHPGDTRGRDPEVKSFKLVFNASGLQRFLTLGDDVAAELDVLADLEAPDHAATPGGAV
jgi:hypothetical protein